jgi:hypothetical protein
MVVGCAGRLLFIVNGCFEAADTFSDSFPEFRKLIRSEDQQGNSDDYWCAVATFPTEGGGQNGDVPKRITSAK